MAIEKVDFPIKNGGFFHSYVTVYQRVRPPKKTIQSIRWDSSPLQKNTHQHPATPVVCVCVTFYVTPAVCIPQKYNKSNRLSNYQPTCILYVYTYAITAY